MSMSSLDGFRAALVELAKARRAAKILYQKTDGSTPSSRVVEPYSLEDDRGNLLAVCWQIDPRSDDRTPWRSFRIDRIRYVNDAGITFVPRVPVLMEDGQVQRYHGSAGSMLELYAEALRQFQGPAHDCCAKCAREIAVEEAACVLDDSVVCRECHDQARPSCPYCREILATVPRSKRPCPKCGGIIYVRATQTFFPSVYMTEAQASEIKPFGNDASALVRRVRDVMRAESGAEPAVQEVKRRAYYESCRAQPATYAQLCYASDLGVLPNTLSSFEVGRSLTAFNELSEFVRVDWPNSREAHDVPQRDAGGAILALINDPSFQRLAGRDIEWVDIKLTPAAKKYLKQFLKLRAQRRG